MGDLLVRNAKVVTPLGHRAVSGSSMNELHTIDNCCVVIRNGIIEWCGPEFEMPSGISEGLNILDAGGCCVLPGFIDSHTHMIFGGFRAEEFEWRLKGDSYMSIMERGGGIQSTVNATRKLSATELADGAQWLLDRMIEMGVTTVEIKTGYGLDTENELKMLDAICLLKERNHSRINISVTFMGAHAVPPDYKGRTSAYVDLIIEDMLPRARGIAEFVDIFTEKNVFEIEDSRRLLNAAKAMGFKLKMHADEIVTLGGSELAAEVGAVSADHLLHISDEGVRQLADRGVVATLLPLTAFSLREPFAPARRLIDAGASVALATDLNPGSCFSGSLPLTIALACIYMRMTVEESITALTINGAAALDMANYTGSIEVGKRGDLIVLEFDNISMLPYYVGMNCVKTTVCGGIISNRE